MLFVMLVTHNSSYNCVIILTLSFPGATLSDMSFILSQHFQPPHMSPVPTTALVTSLSWAPTCFPQAQADFTLGGAPLVPPGSSARAALLTPQIVIPVQVHLQLRTART